MTELHAVATILRNKFESSYYQLCVDTTKVLDNISNLTDCIGKLSLFFFFVKMVSNDSFAMKVLPRQDDGQIEGIRSHGNIWRWKA